MRRWLTLSFIALAAGYAGNDEGIRAAEARAANQGGIGDCVTPSQGVPAA